MEDIVVRVIFAFIGGGAAAWLVNVFSLGARIGRVETNVQNLKKEHDTTNCVGFNSRLTIVENEVKDIAGLKEDVKRISESLNQLLGKIDTFIGLYKKEL